MKLLNQTACMALALMLISRTSGVALGQEPRRELTQSNPYVHWKNGPSHDAGFFPIGVWLQSSKQAKKYLNAGVNTYVGTFDATTAIPNTTPTTLTLWVEAPDRMAGQFSLSTTTFGITCTARWNVTLQRLGF